MAPTQPCAKYQYVVTPNGPKILPVEDPSCKDEESPADYNAGGYLPVKVGDSFKSGRYRVVRKLGWGHFSTVWLVKDTQERHHSALKVVKSAGRYAETARDEIKLLSRVASFSPTHPGRPHIVSFLDSFVNQGPESSHVCIVFEPLGENLLGLIERNKKKGVPRSLVKVIAKQILLGLQYLHDECDLVHTDIKPENILIAIPDIETHIHAELSTSPTPTSRRVGVPLPTKSRAGVTIPHSQQRARRQVQIFDSQPLASPSRSAIDLPRSVPGSLSLNVNAHERGNSTNPEGSLINKLHVARLTGSTTASGTAKSLSSAASKTSGGLTASAPPAKLDSRIFLNANVSGPKHNPLSPSSASSSSSSISSTAVSIAAGSSSVMSTPPTSLSHSLGIAVAGFMGISRAGDDLTTDNGFRQLDNRNSNHSRDGIPVKGRNGKGKMTIEDELEDAASTSWKDTLCKPRSWTDKIIPGLSSSYKSPSTIHAKSKLCQVQSSHHSQPRSGAPSSSFWKDPGTAAPAPAVVVSAVAGADGGGTRHPFDFPPPSSRGTASETSSATATNAHPSRTSTPVNTSSPAKKAPLLIKKVALNILPDALTRPVEPTAPPLYTAAKSNPSLLSQTAPMRATPSLMPTPPTCSRSPPQHTSLLSAHKHSLLVTTCTSHHPYRTSTTNMHTNTSNSVGITPTSITPTPNTPPPAPLPTPAESPSTSSHITQPSSQPSTLPIPVPPSADASPVALPPPITVKIADLGNATPSKKHYTEDIQTRQYRAPEAILGRRDWDARADIWSVACVVFELLTSEFLFDPHGQGERFTKDDDHMAQIIELLGDFPLELKMGGKYSRELFDHTGTLRYIHELRPWPLKRVMAEKYVYSETDAAALSEFLLPMLSIDMSKRAYARDMLDHPWLSPSPTDEEFVEW
ncbi:hypothetical protein DXG01_009515 [Tephrocybe rancida]|nr:hypothetical protein DXG01_009515 [Tephrocybe rancida]